jgi:hypothetical protein
MSTTQNNEKQKPYSRRLSSLEVKLESPLGKNGEISENIKLLSNEIKTQYTKRATMKNNENIHEIISNLFEKESKLLSLTNKQSIIHELDFLQNSPQQQRKKSLKKGMRRRSTMTATKNLTISNQKSFSRTSSDKNQPLRKLSTFNPSTNFSKKNSIKKVEFNIFDRSATKIINQATINSESESESIGEIEREYLLFGFSNTKRIKKNRIRSMENNPKKLGFYEKNLFHKQKKNLEVQMLRNKITNEKQLEFKDAPELSKKTKEIIKERLNETRPLYQRIDEVMETKNNYIHKLKKFHNEDSKDVKWKEFSKNYENTYMNELSNIDNFEFSHILKTPQHNPNSVRNNKTNFNNKFLNSKAPDSANNTFLKMLNDTNIDLHNMTSIPGINTHNNMQKGETMDYSDNFKIDEENEDLNNLGYLEFMRNRKKNGNQKFTNDINNNNDNNNYRGSAEKNEKKNIAYDNFEAEEYVKFDIQYPEKTLNWVKNKEHWIQNKQKKLNDHRNRSEKAEVDLLRTLFKPKTNKNSGKIINAKKHLSRSMNMSQRDFNDNYNYSNINNFSNYNNDENVFKNSSSKFDPNNPNHNTQTLIKSQLDSQEKSIFESLYDRRFDGEEKRKKILQEIYSDFKPKINSDYRAAVNASSSGYLGESLKNTKYNGIPAPKKNGIKNKNENYNFDEAENRNSDMNSAEKNQMMIEFKRQREEERNKKRKGNENESLVKNAKKSLMDMFDEVDKENQKNKNDEIAGKRRKSDSSQLYKLNIRSASAWDKNKENNVYFDRKFAKILSKVGMIKY